MDIITYSLAKKYTREALVGLGALKGAPCTISDIVENPNEIIVTFSWTGNDDSTQSSTITIPTGADGKSLEYNWDGTKLGIRIEGETDFNYTDLKGSDGFSPSAKVTKENNKTIIEITDKQGTTSAEVFDGLPFNSSESIPAAAGKVGDIVFNSLPEPGGYIGWVYTPFGWCSFGKIEDTNPVTFTLSDGSSFILADGSAFMTKS